MLFALSLFLFAWTASCEAPSSAPAQPAATGDPFSDYVVKLFEDSKGRLWMGTINDGVACYDGQTLRWYSVNDGLPGTTVAAIAEDRDGNMWLGTHSGLVRYNGVVFTLFTPKDGLTNERISQLLVDRNGQLWVGTWGGVYRYNGVGFTPFNVPKPEVELSPYSSMRDWVTELMEDRQGNIWIGRDGYGACRYDGQVFAHFTRKEGLSSNNVQTICEDRQGHIWFGSRVAENDHSDPEKRKGRGGPSRYDGHAVIRFPDIPGLDSCETYALHCDRAGNVWIGANHWGVYRYDGAQFKLFHQTTRTDLIGKFGIQSILEDQKEQIWLGLSGGLFRIEDDALLHMVHNGERLMEDKGK
ncbi:MAG: two-component regulator propeller domain-containing protein [Saprospiraceae bacterium]|nr:two-component regulator propeller domain-containing protein [Saprospiraceae bacterium]